MLFSVKTWVFLFLSYSIGVWNAYADPLYFDLISPAHCLQRYGQLEKCVIPPISIPASGQRDLGVPLRTTLTVVCQGDCCSPYPLSLDVLKPSTLSYLAKDILILKESQTHLRASGMGPLGEILIQDKSHWTKMSSFPASCRSQLEVETDVPDIRSKDEALVHVERVIEHIKRDEEAEGHVVALLSYQSAFRLFQKLAQTLNRTSDDILIKDLVRDFHLYENLMEKIETSPDLNLTADDRMILNRLQDTIDLLRESGAKQVDLNSYFNSADRELFDRLGNQLNQIPRYQEQLRQTQQRIFSQCRDLLQLKSLLNSWLSEEDWMVNENVLQKCQE